MRVATPQPPRPRYLTARFAGCPIEMSLGVVGRKWSMQILRDIGIFRVERYHQLLRTVRGIPPKMLSARLKELETQGLIHKVEASRAPRRVRWDLTERGFDLMPVLMFLTAYQSKWAPEKLHPGRGRMRLHEMFDPEGMRLIEQLI